MTIYEKYCQLNIDGRWIGLEKSDLFVDYFCTPLNATVIGWENNIHYCFIKGYRDMVFAVNPEPSVDSYVYPLAMNFKEFLQLILACGSTTAVEQIIGWSKEQFEVFLIRACLKNKYCTKHMFLLPFHAKIKEKGVILC